MHVNITGNGIHLIIQVGHDRRRTVLEDSYGLLVHKYAVCLCDSEVDVLVNRISCQCNTCIRNLTVGHCRRFHYLVESIVNLDTLISKGIQRVEHIIIDGPIINMRLPDSCSKYSRSVYRTILLYGIDSRNHVIDDRRLTILTGPYLINADHADSCVLSVLTYKRYGKLIVVGSVGVESVNGNLEVVVMRTCNLGSKRYSWPITNHIAYYRTATSLFHWLKRRQ